jgi:uncharacterized membrane protein
MSPWPSPAAVAAATLLITGAVAFLMPALTRADLAFAITVRPSFRSSRDGRRIIGRYRLQVILQTLIAVALVLSGLGPLTALLAGIAWQTGGLLLAFLVARHQVVPHAVAPDTRRDADLAPRTPRLPGGALLQAGPFVVLAAVAALLRWRWDALPERFPVHWGADGQPNRWSERTLLGVYAPLLIGLAVITGLLILAMVLVRTSRPAESGGRSANAERRFRGSTLGVVLACEYFLAASLGWAGVLPLTLSGNLTGPPGMTVVLALSLLFVVIVTAALGRLGQSGARLSATSEEAAPAGDRSPDRFWRAGLFYVNPDDPALFVPKRFGLGYTLNFGRPGAWLVLLVLLALPASAAWIAIASTAR